MSCLQYLQYPGPLTSEGIASVDNVPVLGEAGQHVLDTLLERVDLATVNNIESGFTLPAKIN